MVRTTKRRGQRVLVIDFSYTKPDGTKGRYRRDAEVQTRTAALAEARRRLAAVAAKGSPFALVDQTAAKIEAEQAPPPAVGPTFADVVESFWHVYAPSRFKASTRYSYRNVINAHLLPRLASKPVAEIDANVVRELDVTLTKAGVGRANRRHIHVALRSILCRYAVEAGFLSEAPRMPALPKPSAKVLVTISAKQAGRLINAARLPEHRLALLLAFHAGLRAGEIRGLRVCDVDLEARVLRIRQAISRGIADTPKGGDGREVPLTSPLHAALVQAVKRRVPHDRVVLTAFGKPWGHNGLGELFTRLAKRVGIVGTTLHHLRHGFVTALLDRGVGVHVVRELAGHADLETTERYAHAVAATKRAAIDALDALVKKSAMQGPQSW